MADGSENTELASYLSPNFKANVGQPPKNLSEQKLINFVATNKYDKQLTPRENLKIIKRQFQNPNADQVLACPTYLDFIHSSSKNSDTFVTSPSH